jgi:hypothetical protein
MLAIVLAAFFVAAPSSPVESARDRQDRAALEKFAAEAGAAASKAPGNAAEQYRAALTYSYLAEVAIELKDRKAGRQFAEQGMKFAEKAVCHEAGERGALSRLGHALRAGDNGPDERPQLRTESEGRDQ